MKLSDRKKKILQLVIDDYISTAQPVSSKSITEKYMNDISSATVRSELAGLEELGFLIQPHTSSGRIPSVEAYKLYVNELMERGKLTGKEIGAIKNAFKERTENLEEVVSSAVKVISDLTDYTSLGFAAHSGKEKIVKIDIFRYRKNVALLLIVTENTLIKDKYIDIPNEMTDDQIKDASNLLSDLFVGKNFSEILSIGEKALDEFKNYREIFEGVMDAIEDYIDNKNNDIIMEGENKILRHPEYSDAEKVKNFLSVVSSKDRLIDLLSEDNDNIEVSIKIGGDEGEEGLSDCSLVTATYTASGVNIGTYGVIGPRRMDYQKVVSVLEGVGRILEDLLDNK